MSEKPTLSRHRVVNKDGTPTGEVSYWFWCPGCDAAHRYPTEGGDGPRWTFDGNMERPTFSPSLLNTAPGRRCHLFVRGGRIEYCGDCGHSLSGKTVEMVPLPDWLK